MNINPKIIQLVSAIGAAMLLIIMLEWMAAKFAENRLLSSIESPVAAKVAEDIVPEVDLEAKTEESYADLVSRPLFLKGRRPVEENTPENEKEQLGSETFDWRLDGIYTGKNGLSALLSRSKEGAASPIAAGAVPPAAGGSKDKPDKYRRVAEDEDLDGWRLTEIKPDRVVFELGVETKELVLRKPKPKELPPELAKQLEQHGRRTNTRTLSRPGSRTKDIGQIQDEAVRRRYGRRQPIDDSESESDPADDESENGENEE